MHLPTKIILGSTVFFCSIMLINKMGGSDSKKEQSKEELALCFVQQAQAIFGNIARNNLNKETEKLSVLADNIKKLKLKNRPELDNFAKQLKSYSIDIKKMELKQKEAIGHLRQLADQAVH